MDIKRNQRSRVEAEMAFTQCCQMSEIESCCFSDTAKKCCGTKKKAKKK